ncbi:hypothetical protein LTR97_010986 [Elasticomyces elasticus]|uniref:Uncharacterized protein n=1 Tax=Elasticomyces elasticus TaxID=574655 RepID=A0AAN7W989_9PEZI|nr:hypothetical protein LTR97_010986 [Elasticomyces elasticus]
MRTAVLALAGFAIKTLAAETQTLPCVDEPTYQMITGDGPPELANQTQCNPYGTSSYLVGKTSSTSTLSPIVVTETVLATPTVALPTCDAAGKCVFPPSCVVSFPGFISCTGDGSTAAATDWEFASSSTVEARNTTITSTSSAMTPSFTTVIPTNPHDIVLLPNGSPDPQPWTTLFAASSAATTSMSGSLSSGSGPSTISHDTTTVAPPATATQVSAAAGLKSSSASGLFKVETVMGHTFTFNMDPAHNTPMMPWTTLVVSSSVVAASKSDGSSFTSSRPIATRSTTAATPSADATSDPQPWTSIFTADGPRVGPGFLGHNPAGNHAKRQVNAISILNEALSAMESAMPYLTTTTTVQTNTFTVLANTTLPCSTSAPNAGSGYPASSTANASGIIITDPLRPGWSSTISSLSTLNPHINNTSIDSGTYLNMSTFVATQSSTSQNLASTTDSSASRSTVTSTKVVQPSTTETDASKTDMLGFTAAATSNIGNTSSGALAFAEIPGFGNVVGAGVAMAGLCFGAVLLL